MQLGSLTPLGADLVERFKRLKGTLERMDFIVIFAQALVAIEVQYSRTEAWEVYRRVVPLAQERALCTRELQEFYRTFHGWNGPDAA